MPPYNSGHKRPGSGVLEFRVASIVLVPAKRWLAQLAGNADTNTAKVISGRFYLPAVHTTKEAFDLLFD